MSGTPITPLKKMNRPEASVQAAIIKKLEYEGWYVKPTHGNYHQSGFPDLYAVHQRHGPRWIEVKDPNRKARGANLFTTAQMETFARWAGMGIGVWVLVGYDDLEYKKLFNRANWMAYL
jgi:hypothetical protein